MIGHSSILDVTSLWGYSYMWCWRRYHAQWAGSCWLHRIGQGMSCSELLLRKLLLLWELSALCFSMAVEQESDQNPSATTRSNGLGIKTAAICWEWCSILAHLQTQLCCMVSYICHKLYIGALFWHAAFHTGNHLTKHQPLILFDSLHSFLGWNVPWLRPSQMFMWWWKRAIWRTQD